MVNRIVVGKSTVIGKFVATGKLIIGGHLTVAGELTVDGNLIIIHNYRCWNRWSVVNSFLRVRLQSLLNSDMNM